MQKWLLISSLVLNFVLIVGIFFLIQKLGGLKYLIYRSKHDGITGIYEHRRNVLEKMPASVGEIVFLGDSHTAYFEWAEVFNNPNIKNRGIAGDGTDGVLYRLPSILASKPEKIFLMVGVNDLLFKSNDQILQNYQRIIESVKSSSPQTKLFLQSILPVNPEIRSMPISNRDILELNRGIEKFAKTANAQFINLYPHFIDSKGLLKSEFTKDGIHLDQPGYEVWVSLIREFVL